MWHIVIVVLGLLILVNIIIIWCMVSMAHDIDELEYVNEIEENKKESEE